MKPQKTKPTPEAPEPNEPQARKAAVSASETIDRQLAADAVRKRRAGEMPTSRELAALRRVERAREEELRWTYYRTIPQKHWVEMSGRQTKILHEQSSRYGIPVGGRTIDLSAVARALHDFLAKHKSKFGGNHALMNGAVPSPALERYRAARAQLVETEVAKQEGRLLDRDKLYRGFSAASDILRRAGETLQRRYGREAQDILDEALDEFERKAIEAMSGDDQPD